MDPISLSTYARCQGLAGAEEDLLHTQASNSLPKLLTIDFVPIAQQVKECCIFRKGFYYLLPGPQGRRMLRHVEVQHPSALMSQHHQDKQDWERCGGGGKEIDRDQFLHVVG
jgi:hypothetical protein